MRDSEGNKRRVSLTESELALGMWLYTLLHICKDPKFDDIYDIKEAYAKAHHFPTYCWTNLCKLCTEHISYSELSCKKCPLLKAQENAGILNQQWCGCENDQSWYHKTCYSSRYTHKERIEACINICRVLAKELRKSR